MSADGQRTKWRRKIAENFNRLSRVHERYRQTDRQTGGRRPIAKIRCRKTIRLSMFSVCVDLHEKTTKSFSKCVTCYMSVSFTVLNDESCSFLLSLLFYCDDDVVTTDQWLGTTTILWRRLLSTADSHNLTRSVHGTVYGDEERNIAAQWTIWQLSSEI